MNTVGFAQRFNSRCHMNVGMNTTVYYNQLTIENVHADRGLPRPLAVPNECRYGRPSRPSRDLILLRALVLKDEMP
eukprot:scaffold8604_cov168-Amphora_coffeaeformis.AAC.3